MKTCSKCNQTLPLDHFHKQSDRKDGRKQWCKECQKAHDRTKNGLTVKMYANQKRSAKVRGYALPDYSVDDLYTWLLNNPEFNCIYSNWVESGYQKKFTPSCDRINDYISYRLDNLRLVTWNENLQKAGSSRMDGSNLKKNVAVDMLSLDGAFIQRFHSLSDAARFVNGSFVGIWEVVNERTRTYKTKTGEVKSFTAQTAHGYRWRISTISNDIQEII